MSMQKLIIAAAVVLLGATGAVADELEIEGGEGPVINRQAKGDPGSAWIYGVQPGDSSAPYIITAPGPSGQTPYIVTPMGGGNTVITPGVVTTGSGN